MQEHLVRVFVDIDEEGLCYKVTLKSELPILEVVRSHMDYTVIDMGKEATFYASPKKLKKALRKRLKQAQKRYNAILAIREDGQAGVHTCNLGHNL
jgi:hypothetical protein